MLVWHSVEVVTRVAYDIHRAARGSTMLVHVLHTEAAQVRLASMTTAVAHGG